ncbi:protein chromatin remodeling 24, partial [Quercus suber]
MADRKGSRKTPMSLNDRHYRLLQDLSAPPKPSSKHSFDDDGIPQFSGITDFDSPPLEVGEAKPSIVNEDDDNIPDDSDSQLEKEEPTKVKIKGRRRLCKVSTRDNDSADKRAVLDEPNFADFDSPMPKNVVQGGGENGGGNEIRDILNELSAKFDFMSIEKKQAPKRVGLGEEEKVGLPEYASAGSSFSSASVTFDSSLDVIERDGDGVENVVEEHEVKSDLGKVYEGIRVHGVKNDGQRLNRNEPERVGERLMSKGQPFVSEVEEEEVNYLHIDLEGDNFVGRVHGITKCSVGIEPQPQRVDKKLAPVEQFLVSKVEVGEDDDDDDCVVLSGKGIVKEVKRQGSKSKDKYDDLDGVDVLDDYADDSVVEDDGSITLNGPKSCYKLPGKIAKMLYPHQSDGLRWLWALHCQGKGGILGDDMGLGKTMQICGFLAGLFHSHLIKRAIIVAPKTLLPHWIKELSDKGVLLTTYDIVRNNSKSLRGDYDFEDEDSEDSVTWDYMILDEGHLIKNPSTQRAKSLLEIPSAHRIIISGTPLQNNLKELWALFNFCCPELLGDKKWFKEKFEYAILRGNEKKATDREKRIGSAVAKELRERIQPYFLRRLKSEVFNEENSKTTAKLSKKNEVIVWLRLTSCQRQLYEAFLKSELVLSAFDGSPLAALTILKKICDHPLLLTKRAAEDVLEGMESMLKPEDVHMAEKLAMHIADVAETDDLEEKHDIISCKIYFILSLLDNLIREGHRVLIFSQTRKMLDLIQDFQEGVGAPIFLLTSQVGGLGLTLTKADRVIVVDPAWNPSTDNQSVDRAYRIGQTKDVIVYRLMTCGTVEEKIYRKQIYKGGLFKTATEHKEQIRYFSQQDLRELFSLPAQGFDVSVTQQQLHEEHDCQHIMDDYLKAHIEFLQTQGIAGVSHHSLLFSKTAPVQVVQEEDEEIRDDYLKAHIEFLQTQGIAGVSHHSLLFSKTAPVQVVQEEDEEISKKATTFVGCSSSSSSLERTVDGAAYAFKPKDVNMTKKSSSPDSGGKLTESDIKEKIKHLSQMLANKAMVSRLPDKGEKLQKQIAQLNSELYKMRKEERTENQVIDLDDLSGEIQRVLN